MLGQTHQRRTQQFQNVQRGPNVQNFNNVPDLLAIHSKMLQKDQTEFINALLFNYYLFQLLCLNTSIDYKHICIIINNSIICKGFGDSSYLFYPSSEMGTLYEKTSRGYASFLKGAEKSVAVNSKQFFLSGLNESQQATELVCIFPQPGARHSYRTIYSVCNAPTPFVSWPGQVSNGRTCRSPGGQQLL